MTTKKVSEKEKKQKKEKPSRRQISLSLRFEILKRDNFTCQYCGATQPDVKLQIDHIVPVSKGGSNEPTNLITSCFDCNMGKHASSLDDKKITHVEKKVIDKEYKSVTEFKKYAKKREEAIQLLNFRLEDAANLFHELSDCKFKLSEHSKILLKKIVSQYDDSLITECMILAFNKYYDGSIESVSNTFNKFASIVYIQSQPEDVKQIFKLKNWIKKFGKLNEKKFHTIIVKYYDIYGNFDEIYKFTKTKRQSYEIINFIDQKIKENEK